jgi:23S rRNA (adenine1618-N6)-methyltransferase
MHPKPSSEKNNLHPRNAHRFSYDFDALVSACESLAPFVFVNQYQNRTIDFSNAEAVKTLNKAILAHFYNIQHWDIPASYLCPPIPGRADYIHYLADLLASSNQQKIPTGKKIQGLDIGVGANCVYPIIGHQCYGWRFVGTDIDPKALKVAQQIVNANVDLSSFVACRLQKSTSNIFKGVLKLNEKFDFTMCNPPFHASLAEAMAGTERKWKNLGQADKTKLNFGGQQTELWCKGGESAFIATMIAESIEIAQQCHWFTTLVSKKTTLPHVYKALQRAKAVDVRTIKMAQGQKESRMVAWTFLNDEQQKEWQKLRWER